MAGRLLAQQERRQRARVPERLVVVLDEALDQLRRVRLHHELGVLRPVAPRDRLRVRTLVEPLGVLEPDRERRDAPVTGLRHESDHCGGVDAPAQKRAERHVGHEPAADGRREQLTHPRGTLLEGQAQRLDPVLEGTRESGLPVGLDAHVVGPVGDEDVAGRDAVDAVEERVGRRDVPERQVVGDRLLAKLARNVGMREHGLQLRAEDQPLAIAVVVEGLLAEAIADERQPPATLVEDRRSEHPLQTSGDLRGLAVLREVRDDLGIAFGRKGVPARAQLVAQLAVVVDLAVERDADRPVLVGDWRVAREQVDDRQPRLPHPRGVALERAFGVGPAVAQGGQRHAHARRRAPVPPDLAGDPAHASGA